MKIKTILRQSQRNMDVIFECEHCGETEESWAYDSDEYRRDAIPRKKCHACGLTAPRRKEE